jgi:hypothetical protein
VQITCADGDSYSSLFNTGIIDFLVEVELNDGRKIEGFVTSPGQTALGLRARFAPSPPEPVEYDDIKTLVVL